MRKTINLLLTIIMIMSLFGCHAISDVLSDESASDISSEELSNSQGSNIISDLTVPKIDNINLQNTVKGEDVRFNFVYKNKYIAILHQSGDNYSISFFDTSVKKLCSQKYDIVPAGEFIICFDHGDAYYIVFEGVTYALTGVSVDDLNIEPVADYVYSIERDDSVLWSQDGKWYACYSDNNVKLFNTETGGSVVPYKGVVSEESEMDTTASRISGFNGDKFVYNIVGYEWGYGYGVYDLSTGENKVYDGLYDVHVDTENAGPDKASYEVFNEEIGYIDLDNPDEMIVIYNQEEGGELSARMGYTFSGFYAADGKYYCVISEDESGNVLFTILNADDDYTQYYTYDYLNTFTYYVCGSSIVFITETINENTYTVITLP